MRSPRWVCLHLVLKVNIQMHKNGLWLLNVVFCYSRSCKRFFKYQAVGWDIMLVQGFVNSFPVKYLFMWDFFFRLAFGPAKTSWAVKSPLDPRSLCFSNLQDLDPKPTKFWWAYAGLAGSPTSSLLMCYWSPSSSECLIAFRKRETHLPAREQHTLKPVHCWQDVVSRSLPCHPCAPG